MFAKFQQVDRHITIWIERYSVSFLRIGLGVVFFWFGVLKFFPGVSSAHDLAAHTIATLTFGLLNEQVSVPLLAAWECLIGLGLIANRAIKLTLLLLFAQMSGTVLPLVFFPTETFTYFPYVPTLEGQYIVKNIVLVSAGLVLWSVHARRTMRRQ